ncbi:hypothetical protein BJY52DRAFT_451091 [Lactarius psammicola]|nr:hypothetical protein BJY52DRAFT_451091 [Lactarius psammicola]
MSHSPSPLASSSSSNFQSIINASLKLYEKQTKKDLLAHPLTAQLQSCNSPSDVLTVLKDQVHGFGLFHSGDETQARWLISTVNVLYAFSTTLGEGVGLVFSPAKVIFAGFGVLLLAAKDVAGSQDTLVDLFERIENFFKRLETYTEIPPTAAMTDVIVKIMVEVLTILALATKEIRQGRTKKYLKKLAGKTDIEDALKRLDQWTREEARMAIAQVLKLMHGVDSKVKIVIEGAQACSAHH